jgi:hypothetical protein
MVYIYIFSGRAAAAGRHVLKVYTQILQMGPLPAASGRGHNLVLQLPFTAQNHRIKTQVRAQRRRKTVRPAVTDIGFEIGQANGAAAPPMHEHSHFGNWPARAGILCAEPAFVI